MKICLAVPYLLIRKSIRALLATRKNTEVVVEDVENVLDEAEAVRKARPELLILWAPVQSFDLGTVSRFQQLLPQTKLLLLIDRPDDEFEFEAIRAGAWGCVSTTCSPDTLDRALETIARGEIWVSRATATRLIGKLVRGHSMHGEDEGRLTRREGEVLELVANGLHNKEIAKRLSVSENTVKSHLHTIFRKISVDSRLGATLYYYHHANRAHLAESILPARSADLRDLQTRGGPARKVA
jgi:DNA-binding NarL/FixJ family response regulator